ncbi:MAG: DUF2029 domain-containing protein [Actinobacteria bacterium]|nr:DUF2029 domain-containing protein [Actinomycetota bacterium]
MTARNRANTSLLWLLAVAGALLFGILYRLRTPDPIDLAVYRAGGDMLLNGVDIYGPRDGLPFTYAPFAAIIFLPLAILPWPLAVVLLAAATVFALGRAVFLVLDRLWPRSQLWWRFAIAMLIAVTCEPMTSTLDLGQVNAILLWLVTEDILGRRGGRLKGILTGLAAGIKLTPGLFLLSYLVVRDYRRFLLGVATFVGTVVVALPVIGGEVIDFWTKVTWDVSRIGSPAFASNQSVNGTLWRLLGGEPSTLLWLLIALLAVALALYVSWKLWARALVWPLAATALAMLLASPISWSHHYVWVYPALLLLWQQWRHWPATVLLVLGVLTFYFHFSLLPPNGAGADGVPLEYSWTPFQELLGASYVLWTGVTLCYLAYAAWRRADELNPDPGAPPALAGSSRV